MDLLHLVDRLEELVTSAQRMPIGSRAIIDRRRLLDLVDQMRVVIPQEVREASELIDNREQLKLQAEEEATVIVDRAKESAARLVDEHEITLTANERSQQMSIQSTERLEERIAEANADVQARLTEASRIADQQMADADEYSRELLRRLERQLKAFVGSVNAGIAQLGGSDPRPVEPDDQADATTTPPEQTTERGAPLVVAPPTLRVGMNAIPAMASVDSLQSEAPTFLHESSNTDTHEDDEPTEDLENLLTRPARPDRTVTPEDIREEAANHADELIDDFGHPRLDDEPTHIEDGLEEPSPR